MAGENGGLISGGYNPLEAPDAPTSVSGTAGDQSIEIAFTAPSDVGGAAIDTYIAVAANTSTGASTSNTGASSPITVSSLTNDVAHAISVYAKNTYGYSPAGTGDNVTPALPQIAVLSGGYPDAEIDTIQQITITTTGNATDFGDLIDTRRGFNGGISSTTRGIITGGYNPGGIYNVIQYITIASAGDATDFGDLLLARFSHGMLSNSTRGLSFGGAGGTDSIERLTIATTGNGSDFGDLTIPLNDNPSGCASSTRGVIGGGNQEGVGKTSTIQYVTIASAGNATDFGDLAESKSLLASASSSTRALWAGGRTTTEVDTISYVTIASTGNSSDFGNLTIDRQYFSGTSGLTRAVFTGGTNPTRLNVIDYVTIASTGDATDFGDLTFQGGQMSACSSAHGGLS